MYTYNICPFNKKVFSSSTFFSTKPLNYFIIMLQGYEHVEMNKFYMYFDVHLDVNNKHPILYY